LPQVLVIHTIDDAFDVVVLQLIAVHVSLQEIVRV